jgi:hypothetical protein
MIFQTLSEDHLYKELNNDFVEIKLKIPRRVLEKAIQEVLNNS